MSLVKSIGKQKVNVDFNKDFINLFSEKIKAKDVSFINQTLENLHAADVADVPNGVVAHAVHLRSADCKFTVNRTNQLNNAIKNPANQKHGRIQDAELLMGSIQKIYESSI